MNPQFLLQIENLHVYYGAIHALKGISLFVNAGEIVALIGSNGAGKSTLLKTVSGLLKPSSGSITYCPTFPSPLRGEGQGEGENSSVSKTTLPLTPSPQGREDLLIHQMPPHQIVAAGIAQSPEGRQIFANLSVKENLELGAYPRAREVKFKEEFENIFELFPRLKERLNQNAGTLSGGEQQMLAIARALMAKPKLLLLDEPSLGIAPALVQQIFETLKKINQQGVTILLVEQDAYLALETAHRGYVLETGEITLSGLGKELLSHSEIKKAYLGE